MFWFGSLGEDDEPPTLLFLVSVHLWTLLSFWNDLSVPLKLSNKTEAVGQPLRRTRGGFLSLIKKFLFLGATRQQICITVDNYVENVY